MAALEFYYDHEIDDFIQVKNGKAVTTNRGLITNNVVLGGEKMSEQIEVLEAPVINWKEGAIDYSGNGGSNFKGGHVEPLEVPEINWNTKRRNK